MTLPGLISSRRTSHFHERLRTLFAGQEWLAVYAENWVSPIGMQGDSRELNGCRLCFFYRGRPKEQGWPAARSTKRERSMGIQIEGFGWVMARWNVAIYVAASVLTFFAGGLDSVTTIVG
jgi:hypothetical protein